jgi:hypothetical protein
LPQKFSNIASGLIRAVGIFKVLAIVMGAQRQFLVIFRQSLIRGATHE